MCSLQVEYGFFAEKLEFTTRGEQIGYITNSVGYTKQAIHNYYVSPNWHHALLQNLKPDTLYYYR
jgi:hypothetical protein